MKTKYPNLVLKRGLVIHSKVIDWCRDAIENFEFKPIDLTISYMKTIRNILAKRSREKKTHSPFQLSQYLVSRGFEYGLVSKIIGNESE